MEFVYSVVLNKSPMPVRGGGAGFSEPCFGARDAIALPTSVDGYTDERNSQKVPETDILFFVIPSLSFQKLKTTVLTICSRISAFIYWHHQELFADIGKRRHQNGGASLCILRMI
jgi:hypothetical protein